MTQEQSTTTSVENNTLLRLAKSAAREAGAYLTTAFSERAFHVRSKTTPTDLVSEVDETAEAMIRKSLTAARPDDAVMGEEGDQVEGSSGLEWVIDPLDGTINFIFGIPQWSVSIACEDSDGNALVGVVFDPVSNEMWTATNDGPALLNGEPVLASTKEDLPTALVATGFAYDAQAREEQAKTMLKLLPRVRDIRRFGSAALDLTWTASGRYDIYFEQDVEHWDVAAGALICERAGLTIKHLPPQPPVGRGIVVAPAALVEQLLEVIQE